MALASLGVAACGAQPSHPPRVPLLTLADSPEGDGGPASWRYYPARPAKMLAKLGLPKGQVLYAGEGGERWLTGPKGAVQAAPRLAGESLIFARAHGQRWLFMGESGTQYLSETPLGEFVRIVAPTRALKVVSAGERGLAGVDRSGVLVSAQTDASSEGAWVPAQVPEQRASDRFVDVALVGAQEGYALSLPERLWMTSDAGRSWRLLDLPRVGAHQLVAQGGGVLVRGFYQDQQVVQGALAPITRASSTGYKLAPKAKRSPRASALEQRSAALRGASYVELARGTGTASSPGRADGGGGPWQLLRGTLHGELSAQQVSLPDCNTVKLAAFERRLVVACGERPGDPAQPIHFHESQDEGASWHPLEVEAVGRIANLELALGAYGALLVTGLCKPEAPAAGCIPEGVYTLEAAAEGGHELRPAVTPSLRGRALALGFSPDGRVAVMAGVRAKDAHFAIFTSTDGGKTFRAEDIRELRRGGTRSAPPRVRFGAGDDATFGFSVGYGAEVFVVVTDHDGRPLTVSSNTPMGTQGLGVAGARGLAHGRGEVWETQDGGVSWRSLGSLPGKLCEGGSCDPSVVCSPSGCVVGELLSRSGWGAEPLPIMPRLASQQPRVRRLRTALVCTLSEPPTKPLPRVEEPPSAEAAALGEDAWWSVVGNAALGYTLLRAGIRGTANEPRVDAQQLLAPLPGAARSAGEYRLSRLGVVAMRQRPGAQGGSLTAELAWQEISSGKVKSRSVQVRDPLPTAPPEPLLLDLSAAALRAQGGSFGSADRVRDEGTGRFQAPVRLAPSGVFMSPPSPNALFVDETQITAHARPPWRGPSGARSSLGWAHSREADGQVVALSLLEDAAVVAQLPSGEAAVLGVGTLRSRFPDRRLAVTLTADGGRALLQITAFDERGSGGTFMLPVTASLNAAPVPAPSQVGLSATPARCSASELSSGPRVVEPYLSGGRHPVMVVGDGLERALISSGAALHGTAAAPCLAALAAHGVPGDSEQDHALILPHDLEHAWFFQRSEAAEGKPAGYEPRLMSCRFDPSASVPPELYAQPGVSVQAE